MTRRQRKLDDIILTLAAYRYMTPWRRGFAIDTLLNEIEEYMSWAV